MQLKKRSTITIEDKLLTSKKEDVGEQMCNITEKEAEDIRKKMIDLI